MILSKQQADALLSLSTATSTPTKLIPVGGIIQSRDDDQGINLVIRGCCRVIDSSRQFGSHTILRTDTPYLCGSLSFVGSAVLEEVTASTECEVIRLDDIISPKDLQQQISLLLKNQICPSEYPFLKKLVDDFCLPVPVDEHSVPNFQHHWKILEDSVLASSTTVNLSLVYADKSNRGFHYGQVITLEVLKQLWPSKSLPRALFWSADTFQQPSSQPSSSRTPLYETSAIDQLNLSPDPPTSNLDSSDKSDLLAFNNRKHRKTLVGTSRRLKSLGYSPINAQRQDKRYEAILTMICQYYKIPHRRDNLRQACQFILHHTGGSPEDKLVTVLDQIGLTGRVLRVRHEEMSRLPTPSILIDLSTNPHLLVEAASSGLLCFDPSKGLRKLLSGEITSSLGSPINAVIISSGSHTPSRNFGISWLLPYLLNYKLGLIEVFIASFVAQTFALATPMLFQQIIDRVIGQGATDSLRGFASLMILFMLLELVFNSLRTFQFMEISNRVDISIGSSIISRLLRLNARYFERKAVGELSSRLNELDKIRSFLTGTALTVVLDTIFSLLYFGVMFYYSTILATIVLASVPVLLIIIISLSPLTQQLIRQRAEAYSKTQSYMVEVLNGIQTVKLQNSELSARQSWEDKHLDGINKGFRAVIANTASSNLLQLVNKTTNILIITVGAWLVIENHLTLGGLIAFRIISGYVTQPIMRLAGTWNQFQEVSLAIERLADIVNQPLESNDYESTNISMPPIVGRISFENVGFSYAGGDKHNLSAVSLTIPAGSYTGIVGQSGCGKSTLLKLIPRLYEPTQGRILIDNYDVTKTELYSLRRQLGYVPQDCMLFEGSIYSNISVSRPDADTADVIAAAKLACAHDFIMRLPYGYSTPIGEKGSGLSGGQRQRIALARMLMQNPRLLILDEATSALDIDTEKQVIQNVRQYAQDRTFLMITHRLSSLVHADQIVVMHEGMIDSFGTHDELMSKAGRYYVLYQQQMSEP